MMEPIDTFMRIHGHEVPDMRMSFIPTLADDPAKLLAQCPASVSSCQTRGADECCVPELGRLVLSQIWDKANPTDAFTIRGLWPSFCRTGDMPPAGCQEPTDPVHVKAAVAMDDTLTEVMQRYWPSQDGQEWVDAWNNHGTCMSTIKSYCYANDFYYNEFIRYFTVTLNVYARYDLREKLRASGIVPGNYFTKATFLNALAPWSSATGLYCTGGELSEVRTFLTGQALHAFSLRKKDADTCGDVIFFPKKAIAPAKQ